MIRFLFVYIIHSHLFKRRDIYSKKRTIASFQSLTDGQFWSSRSFLPWNARSILLSKVVTYTHITPAYSSINIHLLQNRKPYSILPVYTISQPRRPCYYFSPSRRPQPQFCSTFDHVEFIYFFQQSL